MKPFRSNFEANFFKQLPPDSCTYEADKIQYTVPASLHKYTPDFNLVGTNIYFETKGLFSSDDRKKHILLKQQHPDKRFILVFMRDQTLSRSSKTKYSDWCKKNGIEYMSVSAAVEYINNFNKSPPPPPLL